MQHYPRSLRTARHSTRLSPWSHEVQHRHQRLTSATHSTSFEPWELPDTPLLSTPPLPLSAWARETRHYEPPGLAAQFSTIKGLSTERPRSPPSHGGTRCSPRARQYETFRLETGANSARQLLGSRTMQE
ncbi:hypothetical protein NDU88_004875 [Pleurodeles waltl]|uniref:Uncharacterized protein n=1 Tax=Pleurodeles waltl TaxID=8319 RepID=A0AAV7PIS9_PLEWA|nr:hypothetical protein NDU88_004875 [Pleurodeles waltl]